MNNTSQYTSVEELGRLGHSLARLHVYAVYTCTTNCGVPSCLQPRCDEPWTEVIFASDVEGRLELIVSPLKKLTPKKDVAVSSPARSLSRQPGPLRVGPASFCQTCSASNHTECG